MDAATAAVELRDAATPERVGPRAAARLLDIHALFAEEMAWVEAELRSLSSTGVAPATQSARHLLEAGGKRVRPLAVLLAAGCFGPIPDAAKDLATVAELVHLATLLHDDVVDDAPIRRGKPTARTVWGNAVSVLAGDLLLTHALERTSAVAPKAVLGELFATLRRLVDGEVIQLRGRTEIDVRPATYFTIVRDKTASLFVWATRAGATVAGAPADAIDALGDFGGHVGMAFQLVDDLLDYAGDSDGMGKSLHADLDEGKLTLPLLLAIEKEPGLARWIEPARSRDTLAAARLVEAVHVHKTCEEVRRLARAETEKSLSALAKLPSSMARDLLGAIASELATRAR
jgi:octaprenyl-diphosphate synthase